MTEDFDRFRDRLPVNPPYDGWLAAAYDAWIPVESLLEDEATYLDSHVRRYRLRLWDPDELGAELAAAGFVDVEPVRGDFQWVATARRPRT